MHKASVLRDQELARQRETIKKNEPSVRWITMRGWAHHFHEKFYKDQNYSLSSFYTEHYPNEEMPWQRRLEERTYTNKPGMSDEMREQWFLTAEVHKTIFRARAAHPRNSSLEDANRYAHAVVKKIGSPADVAKWYREAVENADRVDGGNEFILKRLAEQHLLRLDELGAVPLAGGVLLFGEKLEMEVLFRKNENIFTNDRATDTQRRDALREIGRALRSHFNLSNLIVRPLAHGYEVLHVRNNDVVSYGTFYRLGEQEKGDLLNFRWEPKWGAEKEAISVRALGDMVREGDFWDRISAAWALEIMGEHGAAAAGDLVHSLRENNQALRLAIAEALRRMGSRALAAVEEGMRDLHDEAKAYALLILPDMGMEAIPVLASLLGDETMLELQLPDPIRSRNVECKYRSVQFLATAGLVKLLEKYGGAALKADLKNVMGDPHKQQLAALIMIEIEPEHAASIQYLKDMLKNPRMDEEIRLSAAFSLLISNVDPPEEAIRILVKDIKDTNAPMMIQTMPLLRQIGVKAMPHLIEALHDIDRRQSAAILLAALGEQANEAIPDLVAVLEEKENLIAEGHHRIFPSFVALALAKVGAFKDPYFKKKLEEKTVWVDGYWVGKRWIPRQEKELFFYIAVAAFAEAGADAVPFLIQALYDEGRSSLRDMAAEALAHMGEPAIPELLKHLRRPERKFNAPAASLLVAIGGSALEPLTEIAQNSAENSGLQTLARSAIKQIHKNRASMRKNVHGLPSTPVEASL